MNRLSPSKLLLAAFALAFAFGCNDCGPSVRPSVGALAVLYPDPMDPKVELSSEVSEHKATYNFASVFMGQKLTLPIKVQNTGPGSLTLTNIEVIEGSEYVSVGATKSANPVFDIAFQPETSVSTGESVNLDVTFQPEQLDVTQKAYRVVLTLVATNVEDGRGRVEITLEGVGVSGVCDIASPIEFGAVAQHDTGKQTIELRNPTQLEATASIGDVFGSDAPAFTFAQESAKGSVTLAPNTTRNVVLNFTPTEQRPYLAFVKIRASAACPEVTVKLQGEGVDRVLRWFWVKPDGTREYSRVDFGYASPGVEVRREVTFENLGRTPVQLTELKWMQSEFKVLGEPGSSDPTKLLVPAATASGPGLKVLPVAVKPSFLGPRKTYLKWLANLPKQPNAGTGFEGLVFGGGPDIQTTPSNTLAFGRVALFTGSSTFTKRKVVVANVGTVPVPASVDGNLLIGTIAKPVVTGSTVDEDEISVALTNYDPATGLIAQVGKNTAYVEVTITPKSKGQKTWELSIPSNDADEPVVKITISADIQEMQPCNITVTPGNLNFGLVAAPAYRDLTVNIKNTGTELCLISNVGLQAGAHDTFELPGGPIDSRDLNPGDTLPVVVRAYPKGAAPASVTTVAGKLEFFINSPTAPNWEVPLSATLAQGCLTIQPSDLDFGTVQKGCASSTRTVTIYNACSAPVTLSSINMLDGAGLPANTGACTNSTACPEFFRSNTQTFPVTLNPGGSPLTFTAKYVPIDLGADQGTIGINATQGSAQVTYIVTLAGRGDTVGQNTDVFNQDSKPKADILIAIDDSCSMDTYQNALATNFGSFMQYAQAAGVDYNLAVVTTDLSAHTNPDHTPGVFVSGAAHPEKILTPNTPSVEQKFAAKVMVGIQGDGTESCLEPLYKAMTAPFITNENQGFLRPDAKLALVCVTDAPDQSQQSALFYLNAFQSLKGSKAANSVTFNAIAGFSSAPTCAYDSGPDNGKYAYLVSNTSGVKDDICTPNWGLTLQNMGKYIAGFRTDFYLNAIPDLTGGKGIEVRIDGALIPSTDPRGATVWRYDSVANAVIFEPSYVPEAGQSMSITYFVTCYAP